ncbi:hypothetical protein BHE74_00036442 [Ensete ventricosum]|nr:hypothetical protein BHE74_00036442 [Ensete ventricosum]
MGILLKNICADDSRKLEESGPPNLSEKYVTFAVGKNLGEDKNANALKVRRAGLQKDGSKVVFGVPKPGKKRKFMEVSKHYNTDKPEKSTEKSDSIKFAKYLMPQASQLWRNTSKVDIKGRRVTNLNTRAPKALRSQNVQVSSTVDKDNNSTVDKDKPVTAISVLNGGESSLVTTSSNEEKHSSMETGSFPHVLENVDTAVIESSVQSVPGIPSSKKKSTTVVAEMEEKRRVLSAMDKFSRSEVKGSENPGTRSADVIEPRRSNRRIQPTSRVSFLETHACRIFTGRIAKLSDCFQGSWCFTRKRCQADASGGNIAYDSDFFAANGKRVPYFVSLFLSLRDDPSRLFLLPIVGNSNNILYPKEDKERKVLLFACRNCYHQVPRSPLHCGSFR